MRSNIIRILVTYSWMAWCSVVQKSRFFDISSAQPSMQGVRSKEKSKHWQKLAKVLLNACPINDVLTVPTHRIDRWSNRTLKRLPPRLLWRGNWPPGRENWEKSISIMANNSMPLYLLAAWNSFPCCSKPQLPSRSLLLSRVHKYIVSASIFSFNYIYGTSASS